MDHRLLCFATALLSFHAVLVAQAPTVSKHDAYERRSVVAANRGSGDQTSGCATPRALAAADLDHDGIDDLVVGCGAGGGQGSVGVLRGRGWSHDLERGGARAPFALAEEWLVLSHAADKIAAGDFDGDGNDDVVAGARGASVLVLLAGDGRGALASERAITLPGELVLLRAGEIDRRDGAIDLVVVTRGSAFDSLLLYRSTAGALPAAPEEHLLRGRVRDVAIGNIDNTFGRDVVAATDAGLVLVSGEDRLSPVTLRRIVTLGGPATFGIGTVRALATTRNAFGRPGRDGVVLRTNGGLFDLAWGEDSEPPAVTATLGRGERFWRAALGGATTVAIARTSAGGQPDVLAFGGATGFVAVSAERERLSALPPPGRTRGLAVAAPAVAGRQQDRSTVFTRAIVERRFELRQLASAEPLALLPMRLNGDALDDLVIIERDARQPSVLMSRTTATYTVNSTADTSDGACDGHCTLREAILAANASAGADTIAFNFTGTPPFTIAITSDLPDATEAVTIDGRTQPGSSGVPLVVLDGTGSTGPQGWGISIRGGNSVVRGLALHGFANHSAIIVWVFSGGEGGSVVEGNFVGTTSGLAALGTGGGIDVARSDGNTVGGTTPAARNVVVGTTLPGIVVREGADSNLVHGNYVGLGRDGTTSLPNGGNDIVVFDSAGNTIGGANVNQRNVVTGTSDALGASIGIASNFDTDANTVAVDNLVQGNYFGTNAGGNTGLGPAGASVFLLDASSNTVGGSGSTAGNVIAGSGGAFAVGIRPLSLAASGNVVENNLIGVGVDGTTALAHVGPGVRIYGGAGASANSVIDNVIRNTSIGVVVREDAGAANTISRNRIANNGGLGIDLNVTAAGVGGPTPNDPLDADEGPNDLQNYAVPSTIRAGAVSGVLESSASSTFAVELFMSLACDPSGFGEGEVFLGSGNVTTDGAGRAPFTIVPSVPLVERRFLTATATDGGGSTSELSRCLQIGFFADGFESGDPSKWTATVPPTL